MATIHIVEDAGIDDSKATGDQSSPYKSLQYAYTIHPPTDDSSTTFLVKKAGKADEGYQPAAKAALKKAATFHQNQQKKAAKDQGRANQEAEQESARLAVLEEAKKVQISEDSSLPKAVRIKLDERPSWLKLRKGDSEPIDATTKADADVEYSDKDGGRGSRVRVFGRVHRERKQKATSFITLRDGYGLLQCVLTGQLAKTFDALTLTRETSMEILGEMWEVPPQYHAPGNRELHADFFKIHKGWKAAGGEDAITNKVAEKGDAQQLLDLRHLTLRGDKTSAVMFVRDAVEFAFHTAYRELRVRKVSPPALVQTQVEGGATLFKFDYYGEQAFLTQSSQLYLETCIPSMGDVYCIEKSFRAEKSLTRRHLSEYTHIEAELDFITFADLLEHLEHVMCRVVELTLADPAIAGYMEELNPGFKQPERPFKRMKYTEAIDWLKEHGIKTDEGEEHKFGDDIAEAAERRMTDEIGRPIFLTHFPAEIKAFYMYRDPSDRRVTESVDCLMPGVGEIVGGSMRIDDYDELMQAYKTVGIDPAPYYWYTDQRRYGSSPHGGYGLGLERFLAWMCKLHTVREACLYPRYMGRCTP